MMKKLFFIFITSACLGTFAHAMQAEQEQWLILVEIAEGSTDKAEAFAKIDKEARESFKGQYVRGSEMASMWMLTVNSSQNDIKETLKERAWLKNATMCPNLKLTLHTE